MKTNQRTTAEAQREADLEEQRATCAADQAAAAARIRVALAKGEEPSDADLDMAPVPRFGTLWHYFDHADRTWVSDRRAVFLFGAAAMKVLPEPTASMAWDAAARGKPCVVGPVRTAGSSPYYLLNGGVYDARYVDVALSAWPDAQWTAPVGDDAQTITQLEGQNCVWAAACARVGEAIVAIIAGTTLTEADLDPLTEGAP